MSNTKCSRCLAEFDLGHMPQGKPYRLGCKHKFCEGCFEEILSEIKDEYLWCPLCRFKVSINELRESDPQMFTSLPKTVPSSSANGSMNFLNTSQASIEVSSYNSSKSIDPGSFTPDPNVLSKSPRQTPIDNPQYHTSPSLQSKRKNSAGKYAIPTSNYMSTENYLSKSPTKAASMGHTRKASTASNTGYITTEAYSSSTSVRTSNNSTGGKYNVIDEESPLFGNEINKWTMISDTDYLAHVTEPRPNVLISVILSLLLVGMLPALNLFRFYIVDNRFRHPLSVGMLTFATIFIGSSFYFLMRQRRVKKREKKRRKRQQQQERQKSYGTGAPVLSINESVNELFQNRSHGINNSSEPQSANNINGLSKQHQNQPGPSDFFKKFQRIAFIFLTCLIMILFFIVSWFSSAWNICGVPTTEPMANVTVSATNPKYEAHLEIETGESNENLCAIIFGSNTVVLYLVSLIWKRERGNIFTLLACLVMAVSVSLLFWEEPFKFEVKFNFKVIYLILMVTEPILFGIYFFVLRRATLLNNGGAKVLLVQSFFGLICLGALSIVFEGKQPWENLHDGGLPLICELIVFVLFLAAAVYFIPLICSYSDAITTGFFFQIGWILSDHQFLYPFIIYQTVQWSAPIIWCLVGIVISLAYMTYRIFTIPSKWQEYHLQNKKLAEDEEDSDMEI